MTTTKRTTERTPLLKQQQPTRITFDQYDRPIVDAMMPQPVDAGQCATATVMTSFAAKDLREKDRADHVICTRCTAPSKQRASQQEPHNEEKPTGAERRSVSWRYVPLHSSSGD